MWDDLAGGSYLVGAAVVNVGGGVEPDAGVAVVVVVVLAERVAERPGVVEAGEALRERRRVLQRLELGFAEGVVVAHVGSGVGLLDAEISAERSVGKGCFRTVRYRCLPV